ncbi:sugar transferase [Arthrobacter pigmenti]
MKSSNPAQYLRRRYILDRAAATILLVLIAPLMSLISIIIIITTGLPVFFRQPRVGVGGTDFKILKFRTMITNAEAIQGGHVRGESNLITPIGRFLRKTSLDELPQLINIARGEMAFIGPRPALRYQYMRYNDFQRRRVEILQGVTGLAQITYRNDAPWSKRIELDVHYIDHASPIMDMKVVFGTLSRVTRQSGVRNRRAEEVDDLGRAAPSAEYNQSPQQDEI